MFVSSIYNLSDSFRGGSQKCGIYAIFCDRNNKYYVGSSKRVASRLATHRYNLRKGLHQNHYLQNSFNKYGESSILACLVEECDESMLIEKEKKWIDLLFAFSDGFNQREFPERNTGVRAHLKQWSFTNPSGVVESTSDLPEFCKQRNLLYGSMLKLASGKIHTSNGWKGLIPSSRKSNASKISKKFSVIHENGKIASGVNRKKFAIENGIKQQNFNAMLNGAYKSCGGWRVYKNT